MLSECPQSMKHSQVEKVDGDPLMALASTSPFDKIRVCLIMSVCFLYIIFDPQESDVLRPQTFAAHIILPTPPTYTGLLEFK